MRIALVSESFYPAVDSTTTTVRAVADRLVDTGHQVLVVAPGPDCVLPGLPGGADRPAGSQRAGDGRAGRLRRRPGPRRPPPVPSVAAPSSTRRALRIPTLLVAADTGGGPRGRLLAQHDGPSGRPGAGDGAVDDTAAWPSSAWRRRSGSPGVDTRTFDPSLRDPDVRANWARHGEVLVGYVGGLRNRHDVRRLAELGPVRGTRLVVVGDGPQRRWLEGRLPTARFLGPLGTQRAGLDPGEPRRAGPPGSHRDLLPRAARGRRQRRARGGAGGRRVRRRGPADGDRPAPRSRTTPLGLVRARSAVVADRHRALLGRARPPGGRATVVGGRGRRAGPPTTTCRWWGPAEPPSR